MGNVMANNIRLSTIIRSGLVRSGFCSYVKPEKPCDGMNTGKREDLGNTTEQRRLLQTALDACPKHDEEYIAGDFRIRTGRE